MKFAILIKGMSHPFMPLVTMLSHDKCDSCPDKATCPIINEIEQTGEEWTILRALNESVDIFEYVKEIITSRYEEASTIILFDAENETISIYKSKGYIDDVKKVDVKLAMEVFDEVTSIDASHFEVIDMRILLFSTTEKPN
jgi:hypothetical protein